MTAPTSQDCREKEELPSVKWSLLLFCVRKARTGVKQTGLGPGKLLLEWDEPRESHQEFLPPPTARTDTLTSHKMHFPKSGDNAQKRDSDTGALHISGRPLGSPGLLTWGQGLLQFLCLLLVYDDQGVKVSSAPNFKTSCYPYFSCS